MGAEAAVVETSATRVHPSPRCPRGSPWLSPPTCRSSVAAVLGVGGGYRPLSDDGILLVRARDVGSVHTPLLGSATSASTVLDRGLNNAGPLYFDLVALPVKVFGPWIGLVVGVALVNVAVTTLALVFRAAGCGHGRAGRGGRRRRCAAVGHARGAAVRRLAAQQRSCCPSSPSSSSPSGGGARRPVRGPLGGGGRQSARPNAHELRAPRGRADPPRRRGGVGAPAVGGDAPPARGPLLVTGAVVAVAWAQPLIDQVAGRGNLGGIAGTRDRRRRTLPQWGWAPRCASSPRCSQDHGSCGPRMGVPCRSPRWASRSPGSCRCCRRAPCCWRWWAGWQHSPLSAGRGAVPTSRPSSCSAQPRSSSECSASPPRPSTRSACRRTRCGGSGRSRRWRRSR